MMMTRSRVRGFVAVCVRSHVFGMWVHCCVCHGLCGMVLILTYCLVEQDFVCACACVVYAPAGDNPRAFDESATRPKAQDGDAHAFSPDGLHTHADMDEFDE